MTDREHDQRLEEAKKRKPGDDYFAYTDADQLRKVRRGAGPLLRPDLEEPEEKPE
jgi:hypothetical protein